MNINARRRAFLSDNTLYGCILLFILITVFLLPSNLKSIASLVFSAVLFLLVSIQRPSRIVALVVPRSLVFCWLVVVFGILASICFSPYSKSLMVVYVAFLLLSSLIFSDNLRLASNNIRIESIFYVIVLLVLICELIINFGKKSVMYINGAYDKNYLGILLFLFFAWCWATGRKTGVALCVLASAVIGSRNYTIMLLLFVIFEFLRVKQLETKEIRDFERKPIQPVVVFSIFILMLFFVIVFSYWWSNSVVGSNTAAYQAGINDSSNAVRFNSDWYAFQHLLRNHYLLLYGYDNDIIDAMHIIQSSELNGTESALIGTFYNGFRIVQPHHVILNMLLKEGCIFTVGYYAVLSCILSRFLNRHNLAYWVSYLFACMFMHSLLTSYYLIFFLAVLSRSETTKSASLSTYFRVATRRNRSIASV